MLFSLFIFTWFAGSIFYVFKLRGDARYVSFTQYLRKSWPIFAPFNSVLYLFTRKQAQGAYIDPAQYKNLHVIKDNYQTILEEVQKLYSITAISAKPTSQAAQAFTMLVFVHSSNMVGANSI
ncbi:MAG: hypothetical protein U5L01_18150 [Rheinheimera sp.]|nr:hypothetical protein [Rheinheimera sp.]